MKHSSKGNFTVYEEEDICSLDEYSETLGEELEDKLEEVEQEIEESAYDDTEVREEITALQTENTRLKATLPTTTGSGENVTLSNTAELEFITPPLPRGNSEQDGEPSPTNEVPITNVTGDVEGKIQNKNLCKINSEIKTAGGTDLSENGISYSIDNEGTITLNGTANYTNTYILSNLDLIPNTYNISMNYVSGTISSGSIIRVKDDSSNNIKQITANNNDVNDSFTNTVNAKTLTLYIVSNKVFTNYKIRLQIEQGSTATTYTPHQEQTFTFPLGNQRLMLGDYLADDGIHHVRKQVEITEEMIIKTLYTSYSNLDYINIKKPTDYVGYNKVSTNTSLLSCATEYTEWNFNLISNISKYTGLLTYAYFSIGVPKGTTYDDIKDKLIGQTIEYELATEEITPYTTEQQQAYDEIKQAISYEEQTNISGSSDESNPLFSVEAYQSTKLILQEISNAVVALGGV